MSDATPREIRRLAQSANLILLTPGRFQGSDPSRPLIISVVRNEEARLGDFLSHYRALGAAHFLFIDNGSTDGSRRLLASEPDVDLFEANASFDARSKHSWISRLVWDYGDRWYLLADADEHAVFHGVADLRALAETAEKLGKRRVRAVLLDMYGEGPIGRPDRAAGESLLDAYPYFDSEGYVETREAALTTCVGGPRRRVFSSIDPSFAPQLTKYPFFRLQAAETLVSPHYIDPPLTTDDPCWIALMHFKFDADSSIRIADAVERKQYWRESYEYRIYDEALKRCPDLNLMSSVSRCYSGAAGLVELGIIDKVPAARRQLPLHSLARFIGRKMA